MFQLMQTLEVISMKEEKAEKLKFCESCISKQTLVINFFRTYSCKCTSCTFLYNKRAKTQPHLKSQRNIVSCHVNYKV
jgi:hypothetical protein